jgi:hypothetical protein
MLVICKGRQAQLPRAAPASSKCGDQWTRLAPLPRPCCVEALCQPLEDGPEDLRFLWSDVIEGPLSDASQVVRPRTAERGKTRLGQARKGGATVE